MTGTFGGVSEDYLMQIEKHTPCTYLNLLKRGRNNVAQPTEARIELEEMIVESKVASWLYRTRLHTCLVHLPLLNH